MNTNTGRRKVTGVGKYRNWDIGSLVIAAIAVAVMAWELLSRPVFMFQGHEFQVTQGMLAGGLLFGGLVWMIIEIYTPAGKGIVDLIARPFVGFAVGAFIGGFYGYEFSFGAYVILPAHNGNLGAQIELLGIFLAFAVFVLNAAWSHSRSYLRGGKRGKAAMFMLPFASSSGSTLSGSGIVTSIWNLIYGFLSSIVKSVGTAFGGVITSMGTSFGDIVNAWVNGNGSAPGVVSGGMMGPLLAVVSLGATFIVGYFMLDFVDVGKDVAEAETEL